MELPNSTSDKAPYYLFLDDIRKPIHVKWITLPLFPWTIVRTYEDFINTINRCGIPQFVSYDHDLGEEAMTEAVFQKFLKFDYSKITEKTGMDCAKFLVEKCMNLNIAHPEFTVHSINPVGVANIKSYIENYNTTLKFEPSIT